MGILNIALLASNNVNQIAELLSRAGGNGFLLGSPASCATRMVLFISVKKELIIYLFIARTCLTREVR